MASIKFDFSNRVVQNSESSSVFRYKDIGTSNLRLKYEIGSEKAILHDIDTSNIDKNAIKASLTNIFNFRYGESILNPNFGISPIFEHLYTTFDKLSGQKLLKTLRTILETYEPRIEITSMPATYSEDKNEYQITINYIIPELNEVDSFSTLISSWINR